MFLGACLTASRAASALARGLRGTPAPPPRRLGMTATSAMIDSAAGEQEAPESDRPPSAAGAALTDGGAGAATGAAPATSINDLPDDLLGLILTTFVGETDM